MGAGRDDVQDGTSGSFGGSRPAVPGPGDPAELPVPEQVRALLVTARELSDACADLADALRPATAPGADPLTMDYRQLRAERTADLLDEAASISRGTFGLLDSAYAALTDQHTPSSLRPRPAAPTPARPADQPVDMWIPAADRAAAARPAAPGAPPDRTDPDRTGADRAASDYPAPDHPAPDYPASGYPAPDRTAPDRVGPAGRGTDRGAADVPGGTRERPSFAPVPVPGVTVPAAVLGAPEAATEPVPAGFVVTHVPAVTTPAAVDYGLDVGPVPGVSTPEAITYGPPPVPEVTTPDALTYRLAIQPVPAVTAPAAIIPPPEPEPEPEPFRVRDVPAVSAVPPIVPVRALPDPVPDPVPDPDPGPRPADLALEELFLLAADPAGPMAHRDDQPEEPDVAEPAETPEPGTRWPATWSEPGAATRPPPTGAIPAPRDSTWPDAFVEQKTRTDLPVPAAFAQPPRYEPAEANAHYQTNPRGHYEDFLAADDPRSGNGAGVSALPSHDEPAGYGMPPGSGEIDLPMEDPANPATLAVLARQIEAARRHLQAAVVVGHKLAATLPPDAGLGVVEQLLADLTQVARATRETMSPGLVDRTFPGEARFLCAQPWERACMVSADHGHEPAAPHGLARLLSALGYDADTTSGVGGAKGVAVRSPRYSVHIALVEPAGGGRQRWSGALEWVDANGVTRTWAETLGPVELDEEELARRVDELVRRCVGPQT
jgi:hypothetical protein